MKFLHEKGFEVLTILEQKVELAFINKKGLEALTILIQMIQKVKPKFLCEKELQTLTILKQKGSKTILKVIAISFTDEDDLWGVSAPTVSKNYW